MYIGEIVTTTTLPYINRKHKNILDILNYFSIPFAGSWTLRVLDIRGSIGSLHPVHMEESTGN